MEAPKRKGGLQISTIKGEVLCDRFDNSTIWGGSTYQDRSWTLVSVKHSPGWKNVLVLAPCGLGLWRARASRRCRTLCHAEREYPLTSPMFVSIIARFYRILEILWKNRQMLGHSLGRVLNSSAFCNKSNNKPSWPSVFQLLLLQSQERERESESVSVCDACVWRHQDKHGHRCVLW